MNSSLLIRKASLADLDLITQLFRETILSVNSRDYSLSQVQVWSSGADNIEAWRNRIDQQYFLVALYGNALIGFASLENNGYLDLLYVHKDWQGKQVAAALYRILERYALENKMNKIFSDVSITAKPFFEKFGFMVVAEQRKMIGETDFLNYRMEKVFS